MYKWYVWLKQQSDSWPRLNSESTVLKQVVLEEVAVYGHVQSLVIDSTQHSKLVISYQLLF